MSTNPAVDVISPPGGQRSWSRIIMLSVIFLSGGIVGFAAGGYWMRDRMNFMIRHPQQVMDRLFPQIQSELGLNDEQARKVEEIMRQRYASMESVRAEFVPKQMAQFEVLNNEVAQILNPEQKSKWSKIVRTSNGLFLGLGLNSRLKVGNSRHGLNNELIVQYSGHGLFD